MYANFLVLWKENLSFFLTVKVLGYGETGGVVPITEKPSVTIIYNSRYDLLEFRYLYIDSVFIKVSFSLLICLHHCSL